MLVIPLGSVELGQLFQGVVQGKA